MNKSIDHLLIGVISTLNENSLQPLFKVAPTRVGNAEDDEVFDI
jgi:hypothetical protein